MLMVRQKGQEIGPKMAQRSLTPLDLVEKMLMELSWAFYLGRHLVASYLSGQKMGLKKVSRKAQWTVKGPDWEH